MSYLHTASEHMDEMPMAPAGLIKIDAADVDAGWKFVEIDGAEHKAAMLAAEEAPVEKKKGK